MHEMERSTASSAPQRGPISAWRITAWLCAGVIFASVVACVGMAAIRSKGLAQITVTALDADSEPRDHHLPLVKRKEALPDYELVLILSDGRRIRLGAKPDTSAADSLTWHVSDPVSVADVASVRLDEQDKLISDAVAEVQIVDDSTTSGGYQFQFASQRSFSVGVRSFFGTPIGAAIAAGFCIAVLLMVLSAFC